MFVLFFSEHMQKQLITMDKNVGPPKDEICQVHVSLKWHHLFKSAHEPQECHELTQI